MKRWLIILTAVLGLFGMAAPALADSTPSASPAAAADVSNDHITSYYTGLDIGGNGSGQIVDGGTYNSFTAHLAGQVTGSWPALGGNANSTYGGDNVWFFTFTGDDSTCIQVSGAYLISANSCGGNHPGSLFISTRSPFGISGQHGLVNAYNTAAHGGNGQYTYDGTVHGRVSTFDYGQYAQESFTF